MVFSYLKTKFVLKAKDEIFLPPFSGATFRGGFGNALKRVCCALKKNDCVSCILNQKCVYSYIFETIPNQSQIMKKYRSVPHPFVIETIFPKKNVLKKDENFSFNLINRKGN